jgi:signal transduction histidine kinase
MHTAYKFNHDGVFLATEGAKSMSQPKRAFKAKAISDTTWRRLRNTPSYFFLVWRWSTWLYALIVIMSERSIASPSVLNTNVFLLVVTFIQTLIVTLYAPVIQILLPRLKIPDFVKRAQSRRLPPISEDEEADILTPLAQTRNLYWNIAIYGLDVLICGLAMYYSGPFNIPPFGEGSPFYRYGMSTALAAGLAYRYWGGLAAAIGYDLFAVLGMVLPAPGAAPYIPDVIGVAGSLIDTPIAAILSAYVASLLASYAQSKRREQDNVRRQKALVGVGQTIIREANDRQRLLQKSAEQIRQGGHFHRLVVALISTSTDEESNKNAQPEIDTCIAVDIPDSSLPEQYKVYLEQTIRSEQKLSTFDLMGSGGGIARLYLPFFKEGQVQMVIGAESRRRTHFDSKQEDFLTIAGAQLLIALDNIHLAEQTLQLAASAERGRIAREIHDGIAQLVYMLSLNAETCSTQAHRIAEASEEDAELLTPLAQRLDKLVTISKQALWETRNYMFSLRPLMSGTTTLTQMLTNQVREFEAISDLPVHLTVEGTEENADGDRRRTRQQAQVGAAIFRIVQEALTNAYKHAEATQIEVHLRNLADYIEVEVRDNGHGQGTIQYNSDLTSEGERQRIYSGHGLNGMRERAEELGGTLEVAPAPDEGVKVHVRIPIQ